MWLLQSPSATHSQWTHRRLSGFSVMSSRSAIGGDIAAKRRTPLGHRKSELFRRTVNVISGLLTTLLFLIPSATGQDSEVLSLEIRIPLPGLVHTITNLAEPDRRLGISDEERLVRQCPIYDALCAYVQGK